MFVGDCDQQAACGLGIEENCLEIFRNSFFVADYAFCEIAIIFQAARDVAGADAIESAFEQRDLVDVEAQRDI